MKRCVSRLSFLLVLLFCQGYLFAELPFARLFTLFPPGGKAGTQVEVNVTGADLDEATQLHFSDPGISSKQKVGPNGSPEPNKFLVSIASNVVPALYDGRVVGRFGISNPRSFVVSDLTESVAPATNKLLASSSSISLDTIVNSHSEANAEEFYKFNGKKGQRILIECMAREIDSRMDAAMVLFGPNGKELQRNRSGGMIDFTAPTDGEYTIKVHDFLFRGGAEYFYRLSVRTGPYIDFIFPPSGIAGTKGKYVLYGRNLPGSKPAENVVVNGKALEQLEVEIELPRDQSAQKQFSAPQKLADATLDAFEYRLRTPRGTSNPVFIGYATGTVIFEQEPNDQPAQAQNISLPCEYVGQFFPKGDRDWLTFEAKKGDLFWVEVFCQRMGLPTDPFVLIQRVAKNDKGEEEISDVKELNDFDSDMGGVEYKTGTRDPSGRFEADANGVYRILVRDFFNGSEADPRLVYRLSIRKITPDFRLVAVPQTPPPKKDSKEAFVWTSLLRRGETMPIKIMAFRRDGFNGDIDLKIEDLPTGVSFSETTIEKDKSSAILLITAADNAHGWVGPLKIVGKAKIGEGQVRREARGATLNWDVSDYGVAAIQSRLTRDFVLAVSDQESVPISVESTESKPWEIAEKGKLSIPIRITRRADFNGSLKLKATGVGTLEKMKEIDVGEKATNATVQIDLAEHKLAAGTHSFHLQTQTSGKYRNNPEAAKAAEEALKEADKVVTELTAALKKAPEVKQEATKKAKESAEKAKAASDAAAAAAKSVAEAEALLKNATEKLASAKVALEAKSDDQELIAAKDAALKAFEEAQSKSKGALETKAQVEKSLTEAQAKAKADAHAQAAAEKAEAEAPAKLKDAEKKKEFAAARAKETAKIAEPRDVTVTVYSAPIYLKVVSASK